MSPRTRRGGQLLGGRGWSSAAWLVRPELCHARVFLDSASWRGMTRVPPRPRCALCHPTFEAGPSFGDGRGWSSATQFVSTELYRARVFLDSASWRGMTRVPPRLRCAQCHPAPRCGVQLLEVAVGGVVPHGSCVLSSCPDILDSASQRGMTRVSPAPRCGVQCGAPPFAVKKGARAVRPYCHAVPQHGERKYTTGGRLTGTSRLFGLFNNN